MLAKIFELNRLKMNKTVKDVDDGFEIMVRSEILDEFKTVVHLTSCNNKLKSINQYNWLQSSVSSTFYGKN